MEKTYYKCLPTKILLFYAMDHAMELIQWSMNLSSRIGKHAKKFSASKDFLHTVYKFLYNYAILSFFQ